MIENIDVKLNNTDLKLKNKTIKSLIFISEKVRATCGGSSGAPYWRGLKFAFNLK